MSTIRVLQQANVSLVGRVVTRSSHGYFSAGSFFAFVIVRDRPLSAVCIASSRKGSVREGELYHITENLDVEDVDLAWKEYGKELTEVAKQYPEIKK